MIRLLWFTVHWYWTYRYLCRITVYSVRIIILVLKNILFENGQKNIHCSGARNINLYRRNIGDFIIYTFSVTRVTEKKKLFSSDKRVRKKKKKHLHTSHCWWFGKVWCRWKFIIYLYTTINRRFRKTISSKVRLILFWNTLIITVYIKMYTLNAHKRKRLAIRSTFFPFTWNQIKM